MSLRMQITDKYFLLHLVGQRIIFTNSKPSYNKLQLKK